MDCSLPGSFVHGISQARILEWGSIAFSVGKPSHVYHAPGEHHGLRSLAGYSPKGFKDWATKHVSMDASHNRGCHCWTKVSKNVNAEITGERRFGETGWYLIFAYQMWKWLTSNNKISVQLSSLAQLCLTLCNPMNHSMPGLPVHHQLLEFTQTHVHRLRDAIQPSHPRSSPSPSAPNPSQHQSLFQWVNSSHEVAKVLEFQL